MKMWVYNPHAGGVKIPPSVQAEVRARLERHAAAHYAGRYTRLDIRFKGVFCYIDAYVEPCPPTPKMIETTGESKEEYLERQRNFPFHLGRLRYFRPEHWSYCFYTYSHEKYEPTLFPGGKWEGTPEEAFDLGACYLTED